MSALFLFGTLRDPELFAVVFGRPLAAVAAAEARLEEHAAVHALGCPYPVVVARPGRAAPGLVVDGLAATEIERAAFYESTLYELRPVLVIAAAGARAARAFFPTAALPASDETWHLPVWQRQAKRHALAEARLIMALFGRVPAHEIDAHWPEIAARAAGDLTGLASTP